MFLVICDHLLGLVQRDVVFLAPYCQGLNLLPVHSLLTICEQTNDSVWVTLNDTHHQRITCNKFNSGIFLVCSAPCVSSQWGTNYLHNLQMYLNGRMNCIRTALKKHTETSLLWTFDFQLLHELDLCKNTIIDFLFYRSVWPISLLIQAHLFLTNSRTLSCYLLFRMNHFCSIL